MLDLLQQFAGADATNGELMTWLAILCAGMGASAWVGFELARVASKLLAACIKAVKTN